MVRKSEASSLIFLLLPLMSSLLLIFLACFQWTLVDWVTPFLMPLVWLVVFVIFVATMIMSLVIRIINKTWKPFAIHIAALLLYFFFPFNQVVIQVDFSKHLEEREKVIRLIESGKINPNVTYNESLIQLPDEYQHLSKGGGGIMIEATDNRVFFFTYRGVLDHFAGFIYSPTDQKPTNDYFNGDYHEIKKMRENWYWVSSN
ncbi:hypothetical protein BK133_17920 [Paenibacillus sp. FSL H8-0548]|nr:hypothetical protein BK133_17920 [Paenibacillus sp. FSL H8-0548]